MSLPLIIRHADDVEPVDCPCGGSRRILTGHDNPKVSVHRTEFRNAQTHVHHRTTEIYYILKGSGNIILNGQSRKIMPGDTVQIPPGTSHKVEGKVTALVICQPAFDPADEFLVSGE